MHFSLKRYALIFITLLSLQGFSETVDFVDPLSTPTGIIPDLSNESIGYPFQVTTSSSGRYVYGIWTGPSPWPVQVAISDDFGKTWTDPTTTPEGSSTPDIATAGFNPQIITDNSGQYVYAIWQKNFASYLEIQVAISEDYGVTWENPDSTPGSAIPDISDQGIAPMIATDSSGQYVYAIWLGPGINYPIQVAISEDYGKNWQNPTSTPGAIPNLADVTRSNSSSTIMTDSTGRYVYAIWAGPSPSSYIQVAISEDFGKNWVNPTSTPDVPPNIHVSGASPRITTDSSGKYVYAIWGSLISPFPIQVAISEDFGKTWFYPISTPTGTIPNIASEGYAEEQITTDSSGRFVYAIWSSRTVPYPVQVARSEDFGRTWQNPTSTPTNVIPNIASGGIRPQITVDSSGRYVYAIWQKNPSPVSIQVAISLDTGKNWQNPTSTPTGIIADLSSSGGLPQITTDSFGRFVYTIWYNGNSPYPIQVAIGSKTFFPLTNMTIERPSKE